MALTPEERNQFYYGNPPPVDKSSWTDYINPANLNIFGQQNPMYEGLLGKDQSQALSRQSNISGLLGAAAALAQGMGRQGPKRSAVQNILGALGAGYGASGQVYQQGLQNYGLQQEIMQRKLAQQQLLQKQDALNKVLNDPAIANDPAMKTWVLNNTDKAIEYFIKRRGMADFMARENAPIAQPVAQPIPEQMAYKEDVAKYGQDVSKYKDQLNQMLGVAGPSADGGVAGVSPSVIPSTAPVREPTTPMAGAVEMYPVDLGQGYNAALPATPVAPIAPQPQQAVAPILQQSALAKQIAQNDLLAKYWSTEGDEPIKAKEYQAIADNLRKQQRKQEIIINPAATLTNIHSSLQNRVATLNERAKGMDPDQVINEQNDILKDDAKIKEELSQDLFNQKLKLSAAQGGILYETPAQKFDRSSSLRKEYQGIQVVKDFDQVKVAYNQISGALKNPSPANDLAAATKFMKLLDPGSVVRESELGMAMAASPAMERVTNYYNQLKTGQKLTPTQREDFRKSAEMLYKASENVVIPIQNEYRGIAADSGVNPRSVIIKTPSSISAPQQAPANEPIPSGVTVRKVR